MTVATFILKYQEFKKTFSLLGDDFAKNIEAQLICIESKSCDQKTMDYALSVGESVLKYKKIESDFFDSAKKSLEEKDPLEYIGLSSLINIKDRGYGIGLYKNKSKGILGGVIAGFVSCFVKASGSPEYILWGTRFAVLAILIWFLSTPTFYLIEIHLWIFLVAYCLGYFLFLARDPASKSLEGGSFENYHALHPLLESRNNKILSLFKKITIDNYQEISSEISNFQSEAGAYKKAMNDPLLLSSFLDIHMFMLKLDEDDFDWASEYVKSINLALELWDKAKTSDDKDFSMVANVSAEITHLSQDPIFEALVEGYKASLLKEDMVKEYRTFIDETDSPEEKAKEFKDSISNEKWDVAGVTYGFMFANTQLRRRAEKKAEAEANYQAATKAMTGFAKGMGKGLAKDGANVTKSASSGTSDFVKGAVVGAVANQVLKNKRPWSATCRKCNNYEERKGKKPSKNQCPKCGEYTLYWMQA